VLLSPKTNNNTILCSKLVINKHYNRHGNIGYYSYGKIFKHFQVSVNQLNFYKITKYCVFMKNMNSIFYILRLVLHDIIFCTFVPYLFNELNNCTNYFVFNLLKPFIVLYPIRLSQLISLVELINLPSLYYV